MVSRVCSVTMVALVACTPLALVAIQPVSSVGVASAQSGGIGSPGAVVPLCRVMLLASSPSLHHAYHGSLVTPSVCFWTPLCLPVCVMCDVTTCGRLAHSIKKELPLDPVSLTLYSPKHLVPNDASQKVLSLSTSQSSCALFIMRHHSAVCATKPRMCLISFRAHSHQRVTNLASCAMTKEM